MKRTRVIPVLLLSGDGLYKTIKFSQPTYIGDPINAVKIFNDKEVDELLLLDIGAYKERNPQFQLLKEIAGEAFMPMAYGGGISNLEHVREIINSGFEKVVIGSQAFSNTALVKDSSKLLGSQSVVVCVDHAKNMFGKQRVFIERGTRNTNMNPVEYAKKMEDHGAGEIILQSIDKDGTFKSYDFETLSLVAEAVRIPVVVCGGAAGLIDFKKAVNSGASAVAAGSLFVYHSSSKGILINYPSQHDLKAFVYSSN
jgi:cyclase